MNENYGMLLNTDAKLHRKYFNEMVRLLGVQAKYIVPDRNKNYSLQGELRALGYSDGVKVGCIFQDHEDQKTAKKLGWDAELSEKAALISVPYDLPGLQVGCLFEIPSAFDNTPSRLFRVTRMSAKMIYPASITCEIVPEYLDTASSADIELFDNTNFNLLNEE